MFQKNKLMRKYLIACWLLSLPAIIPAQEGFPVNGAADKNHNYHAFINARIYADAETVIEKGTLLVKDGRVVSVAATVEIPKGSVIHDLNGKTVYPGLIDAYTSYGMPEVKRKQGQDDPQPGAYNWNQAVKPETDAFRVFAADEKAAEELRKLGFGSAMTFVKDGIARGSATFVTLGAGNDQADLVSERVAACYSFDKGTSTQGYPSSLMGSIALLRQTYLDADWYKNTTDKKERNISLDAMNQLRPLPQIFETTNKLNVLRADKVGDEAGIQYIFKGSGTEYQRIDEMRNTFGKFILPLNFPMAFDVEDPFDASLVSFSEMKHWEMAPLNPAALEQKGIVFAITSSDLKDKKEFWKNLRKAIQYGLSEKTALKALTTVPAEMLGVRDKVGALRTGMLANFIITSGNLFAEKTVIYENWVQGKQYVFSDMNAFDIRGTYDIKIGNISASLKIAGDVDRPKGNLMKGDSTKESVSVSLIGHAITMSFVPKNEDLTAGESGGTLRMSGSVDAVTKRMLGRGQLSDGSWFDWSATFKTGFTEEVSKPDTSKKEIPSLKDVPYPFSAYGKPKEDPTLIDQLKNRYDAVLIKDVTIWTNEADGILKEKDVYMTQGLIVRIDDNITPTKGAFAKIIDGKGKHLTPGIIDEHSHIAAEVRIGDVINSEDINIYRQLAGGVTACQVLHGSANPIGGQSGIIKLRWGKSPEEMKIAGADGFIKFALGENVKHSNHGDNNTTRFPQTRMGVEQFFYDNFIRAREYDDLVKTWRMMNQKSKGGLANPPRRDLELEALAEILKSGRFITCHSYVQSEINMLMHVADSMGFKINTFTHILEGYKLADKMKAHGANASSFSDWWAYKMEVMEAIPYNGAILHKMGVNTAYNSDDAEMARRLNQEAAKAVKYGGVSEEEALKFVTLNSAKMLHLDKKMGSIKVGKDADVVLWSDNPLSIYAKAEKTIIDGLIYYDIDEDKAMREQLQKERARLVQKMITEKNGGAPVRKPQPKSPKLQHCDSSEDDYMEE
ncbi:MAG: amidohydrolase [Bacteroidetes bacterium]|nr:MAG: amidohydrolase [Bacteroidota bacterium]